MELNDLRSLITLLAFLSFLGIVLWAYSARRKPEFARIARSVLEDEEPGQ